MLLLTVTSSLLLFGCGPAEQAGVQPHADAPAWAELNESLIKEHNVAIRTRDDITPTGIQSNVGDGVVVNIDTLAAIELAPGVSAKAYWGSGNLMSFIDFEPNATIPAGTIKGERFMIVFKGQVQELANGELVTLSAVDRESPNGVSARMPKKELIYLEDGAPTNITAGPEGARVMHVYAPVPAAWLEMAGAPDEWVDVDLHAFPLDPNVTAGKVYDLYDFQYTELVPGANSRLISGRGTQLSVLRMDPEIEFAYHNHPEEQVMIGLRGWIDEYILADTVRMHAGAIVNLPAMMVHGGKLGPYGSDAIDVFFPPRTDYFAAMQKRLAGYHAIIPEDAKLELLADGAVSGPGLNFTEGPAWVNGKLYFSNMYFDAGFNGDPARSAVVEMDPDGSYRYISHGQMQSNGIIPGANGNLIVCDMFGHRVIEMTTAGEVVRTLADSYDGTSIDGPNDLVMDAKGGIYFSDPQFTADAQKFQAGRTVYYRNPEGEVIRLLPFNDFAMPNGVILSPDGKTLYINNTYDKEEWWNVVSDKENFVWAYDVADDGSISNGRKFATLNLTGEVLDRGGRTSGADGMAVDTDGNLYVASFAGLQIFNAEGAFLGMLNMPTVPVSVTFGGVDNDTLYITSYDKIYSMKTSKKGFQLPN
ncbi:MAG: SMP-30/gluconolactonase/LRE family protein [Gammaproteobacteria bacterium]|nr:SMP-30/gluconolactonase/LRE family protein [Gammaproteobacteria bacterium]MDH5323013.1 SMP-30/gluconolactonase/LRE family protein [Gammaproteobacteria bacterium]